MKKLLFWMVLIVGIVALIGSCAKKDDSTTTTSTDNTTAAAATTYVSTSTTASGSITVGSETMSGVYASECLTSNLSGLISAGRVPLIQHLMDLRMS